MLNRSLGDNMQSFKAVLLLIFVPLLLISPASSSSSHYIIANRKLSQPLLITTYSSANSSNTYAVVFDAGSSGSRVHVYHFDRNLDLLPVGNALELFAKVEPGLSSYADNVTKAAESLIGLLKKAEAVIPPELHSSSMVRLGATAGLRFLPGNTSEEILDAVRNLLKEKSDFKLESDAVSLLTGNQEGSYYWVAINFLDGNLGKEYESTFGVVDLGGGSVQVSYALSKEAYDKAPEPPEGEEKYVKKMYLNGTNYYLYVHSYLGYGILAARAGILNVTGNSGSPCILDGYNGTYTYNRITYNASASSSGSSIEECKNISDEALRIKDACNYLSCTFGGVWSGGGGRGLRNLYLGSAFFYRAAEAGIVNESDHIAKARPSDYKDAAEIACKTKFKDAASVFPGVKKSNLPYLCLELVYQYSLLVDGFGLHPSQEITLVNEIKYQESWVQAAWPLGSAVEAVSSLSESTANFWVFDL